MSGPRNGELAAARQDAEIHEVTFRVFESTVMALWNRNLLTRELLEILMEQHRGTDIAASGEKGSVSTEGMRVEEIVIRVLGGSLPPKPEAACAGYAGHSKQDRREIEEWNRVCEERFDALARERFGW